MRMKKRFQSRARSAGRSTIFDWFISTNLRIATFISFLVACGSGWRWPGRSPLNLTSC